MEVSDCGLNWVKRLFVGMNQIKENDGLIYFAAREEYGHVMIAYKYCRKIKPKVIKTHSEIAELLGISKEQLKIVEG